MPEKLYYSIREVSEMFSLNSSTLRYWETEFETIRPQKTASGVRQYTQKDIEEIRMVKFLLKEKGLTMDGARKKIKEDRKGITAKMELFNKLVQIRDEVQALKTALDEVDKS